MAFVMTFTRAVDADCFFWCVCVCVCTVTSEIITKAPKREHAGRLEMSNVPLFLPPLVFCRCLTTPFFLASFVPVLSPSLSLEIEREREWCQQCHGWRKLILGRGVCV